MWDYDEAHNFKGPHDGIGGTVKRKVHQDVSAPKVIINNAKKFDDCVDHVTDVKVVYLEKTEISTDQLIDTAKIKGTLRIHHIDRVGPSKVKFYLKSNYKGYSPMLQSVFYQQNDMLNSDEDFFE